MKLPRFSPLCVRGGFACGWVRGAASPGPQVVRLYVDGRVMATEIAGCILPPNAADTCGALPPDGAGYVIALPEAALDGFPHDLHVSLLPPGGEEIHAPAISFRSAPVRGEVRQQGRNFVGTVWFDARPADAVSLQVVDARGRPRHELVLDAAPEPERFGFPVHFTVRCDLFKSSDSLHFRCAGIELRGSPCSPGEALVGMLEVIDDASIRGWAFDATDVRKPMELVLRVDGKPEQWFRPNIVRADIAERLNRDQDHIGVVGFQIPAPDVLRDGETHVVEIASAATGRLLTQGQQVVRFPRAWVELARGPLPQAGRTAGADGAAPLVSVVVLNRNGAPLLDALLESWARHNTVPSEIILIDHASRDRSLDVARSWQDRLDVRIVALDENRSFSESSNRGARLARGEFVLFLNNDIVWLHDALPAMLAELRHGGDVGIVGLKLLKVVGESRRHDRFSSQVQHLGVRFKLNQLGYWPFEVQPSAGHDESEHGPQYVPAVTGAALLCRKADFEAAGEFDTEYFYGFEDVEFCLRLAYRLRKTVVCRNDCVALHHHGHTRLSGRERGIFDRLAHNATILHGQAGLWAKQAYWRSLVRADGYVTREPITIGLVVPQAAAEPSDARPAVRPGPLAQHIAAAVPRSRVVLLEPRRGWKNVADLHVLVVADPGYDIRTLQNARSDLLVVAWLASGHARWQDAPWLHGFDGWLAPAPGARRLGRLIGVPVRPADPAAPLADVLGGGRWRLRTAIRPFGRESAEAAARLLEGLRSDHVPCWMEPLADGERARMADVRILVAQSAAEVADEALDAGVLNVVWSLDAEPADAGDPAGVVCTTRMPEAAWLHELMETHIGRAFRPS